MSETRIVGARGGNISKYNSFKKIGFCRNDNFLWYVVQCYSGFEGSVVNDIKQNAKLVGVHEEFDDFYIPSAMVSEYVKGGKIDKRKVVYPGYLLVKMKLTEKSWSVVDRTNRVVGFTGTKGCPRPLKQSEYEDIISNVEVNIQSDCNATGFLYVGDKVKIRDGSFQSFEGIVQSVDKERQRVTLSVCIFDRETSIDLEWHQIEKIVK